jgi:hypothetical protein
MQAYNVKQIMIGGHRTGIIGLDDVLKAVAKEFAGRPDTEIESELITRLSKQNYIYEKAIDKYGKAFMREYKKFIGEPFEEETGGCLQIKVLGPGCPNCRKLEQDLMTLVAETKIPADIRIASFDAKFGLQEVKWSVFPAGGSTVWLPRQLPHAKAMEILLTGELMDAQEAFRLGFVNKIVPASMVIEEAERYADIIIKNGPLAVSGIKKAVHSISGMSIKEGMAKELELAIPVFLSEDAKEGPRAFKQKREPVFKNK